jgi:2-polyprenyl-3-methyl-5-hydroxy-6-metoxy-1,4-benzoquinol methylase
MNYQYWPPVFNQPDEAAAKSIILTPEAGLTPDERWIVETDFLLPWLARLPGPAIVDYGCGIGRLAKHLVEFGHVVTGVDDSSTMRHHADAYVQSNNFSAMRAMTFAQMAGLGACWSGAIAVWALQHIPQALSPVSILGHVLEPGAPLLVVNRNERLIPALDESQILRWVDDGYDLDAALLEFFDLEHEEPMPESLCHPGAYLRLYRRKAEA